MLLLTFPAVSAQTGQNLDQFNYRTTVNNDYGPEDWEEVSCPDESSCVSTKWCCGYFNKFKASATHFFFFDELRLAAWLAR